MSLIDDTSLKNILCELKCWCTAFKGNINTSYLNSLTITEQVSQLFWLVKDSTENTTKVIEAFDKLYEFVDNYFNNLDLQTEVNNKINQMFESGELGELLGYDNVIQNKNVLFFGDSTTAGFISDSGSPVLSPEYSYAEYFKRQTKCNMTNYAQGGATMGSISGIPTANYSFDLQITAAINDGKLQKADFVFVNFGINDHGQNTLIGESSIVADQYYSSDRFIDAFMLGINRIYDTNNDCKIIVILPHYSTRELLNLPTMNNSIGLSLDAYRTALIDICSQLQLPLVDFRKCGINRYNAPIYHNGDPLHLTKLGYMLEGEYLCKNWMGANYGYKQDYSKKAICTYNLLTPSMFNYIDNNYPTNYINGAFISLEPNGTTTSKEALYVIQSGYYLLNMNCRAFESTILEVRIYNETQEILNKTYAVSFNNISIPIYVSANILNAYISIKNIGDNNINISNISLIPYGDYVTTLIRNQKLTCVGNNVKLAGNYIAKLENHKIHLNFHFTTTSTVTGNIVTIKNINFNCVMPLINTTDNEVTYLSFRPVGNDTEGHVASIQSGKELFLHGTIYIGDNNTAYEVIS